MFILIQEQNVQKQFHMNNLKQVKNLISVIVELIPLTY